MKEGEGRVRNEKNEQTRIVCFICPEGMGLRVLVSKYYAIVSLVSNVPIFLHGPKPKMVITKPKI